jgi:hypothetical protein
MLWLSEVLIQEHQLDSFEQLKQALSTRALGGERFFSMDVKPPFADTPENWEDQLESAFTSSQQR